MMDYEMKKGMMRESDKPMMGKMMRESDKPMMGMQGDMGHASKVYKINTTECMKKYDQPYVK